MTEHVSDKPKMARDMTPEAQAEALAAFRRVPKPEPMDTTKKASEMTKREREEWLREHARRFG
jgi:hypothetical protein